MKNIPLPGTVTGWRLAVILIILSFFFYYSFLFDEINKEYYSNFNFYRSEKDIKVEAQIPKTIARFDARELRLIVSAQQEIRDLRILVSSQVVSSQENLLIFCAERPSIFGSCYQSSNVIKFGDFEPGEQKQQLMWVTVEPWSELGGVSITLHFSMTHSSDQSPISFGAGATTEPEIDNISMLKSFILGTLLLPPWSNGLIPSLALLYVSLIEHKIQPGQQFNARAKKWLDARAKKQFQLLKRLCIIRAISLTSASLLYFAFCITLFYFLTEQWVYFATGGVVALISALVLYFLENTDISQGDPLYAKSISNSASPSSGNSNPFLSEVSSTLTRMNATLESISKVNQADSDKLVQKLEGLADTLDTIKDVVAAELVKKLERLTDVLQQQKDIVQQFHEEMQRMFRILEKQREIEVNRSSPLDNPYSHLSLFRDNGLVMLFKKELPGLSEQQFRKKLEDGRFAWCILSLFVCAHKEKWDDTLLIAGLPLRSWVSEPVFWEDKNANSIFEQWLDDIHNHDAASFERAIPVILDWMLRFKKNRVEKYLFEFLPEKCSPKTMVALLAEYLDFYQKDGQGTDIQWDKVLNYFLNTNPPTELIADIGRVWYPLSGSLTLWEMVRQKEGEFSEEKWRKVYAALLGWLCFIPDELAQRVASEIYQNKDVRSLGKNVQLARFLQGFSATNTGEISYSHISHVVKNWCQHSRKKREAGFGARGDRPSHV